MKVIFLKDVPRVGKRHDIKEINDGYATNFLIPRRLAILATAKAVRELELHQKEILVEREVEDNLLMKNLKDLENKIVTIYAKSDDKGHLFSAIHAKNISESMEHQHHAKIDEKFLVLPKPIKSLGEFEIPIMIKNKRSSFKLIVEKEQ